MKSVTLTLIGFFSLVSVPAPAAGLAEWFTRETPVSTVAVANGFMWTGCAFDWATSWKQPEGNPLLANGGRFYIRGTMIKVAINGGISVVTYFVAWKWPRARRLAVIANTITGGVQWTAGISNVVRNPHFR